MDMTFNLENRVNSRRSTARFASVAHPSWPELLSRMTAARQASVELARENREDAGFENGSFHQDAAACVAGQARSRAFVNPTDLGNGKPDAAISSLVARSSPSGRRG